jgi:23S rRNA (adenine2503-C2)-methyltransferase
MKHIYNYRLEQITELLTNIGEAKFRAKQIWQWLYVKQVSNFAAMTNLSSDLQQKLADILSLDSLAVSNQQVSKDGTHKWLFTLPDANEIETVFIPEESRGTLCISSQVGCTLNCHFCHTGTQNWVRDLSADQIVNQVMTAKKLLAESNPEARITNIVFMGMGEPLLNYDNVVQSCKILLDKDGLNLSRRKITISTSGIIPAINKVAEELAVGLAISLHAPTDSLRTEIMSINKKYPLKDLMVACENYIETANVHKITFEYVMLKDVNDSEEQAKELARLIGRRFIKVNLIPFNPWPDSPYECSSRNQMRRFADVLSAANIEAPIRVTRGQDIFAACGQLKSASKKVRKSLS